MTNVEAPIRHEEHTHEHGPLCKHSNEEHSHETLFSKEAKEQWGKRFDTAIKIGFLLSTKAEYPAEKRLGMEQAIQKLEFSPDPRSLTPAEQQMNHEFDGILQASLETIKDAPEAVIAQTVLQLRKVRFNEQDQQNLQEKITKITQDDHVHVHADENTLTYDMHVGDTHHTFTYSQTLQILALHMASDLKKTHDVTLHTVAHALIEAGLTLANKRSADNPYVIEHPYALKKGETLQDFEQALHMGDVSTFQLQDMHELAGIHGNIGINENGELVEEVCEEHAQEVDQEMKTLQKEIAQEFQQAVNEQSQNRPQEQQEYTDRTLDISPPGDPSSTFLQDEQQISPTSITDTQTITTSSATPITSSPRRSQGGQTISRSRPARITPSFDTAVNRQPIPFSGDDQQPIQLRAEPRNRATVSQSEIAQPTYIQSESGVAHNVIPFPTLLQREGTTNRPIQIRAIYTPAVLTTTVSPSEGAPMQPFPNRNQHNDRGGASVSVETLTPSFQIQFTDAPDAVRQDALPVESVGAIEGAPVILVNPNDIQDTDFADTPSLEMVDEVQEVVPIIVQAVNETPEEPQQSTNDLSGDTEEVPTPLTELSSFSSNRALPSTPQPERPPQDPKNTLDNTQRATRPVAIQRNAPEIVIGSTLNEALEVAQTVAVQEQKEEQATVIQAVGAQKSEQTKVKAEEQAEGGSEDVPAVSQRNEQRVRQESTETEYTVKTATDTSARVREAGIAPVRQGSSVKRASRKTTHEGEQQATDKGTNEEVKKVQAIGTPVQITTPQRTQSTTTKTTASITTSQGTKLELQVDARHIDHNNPVNTRMLFDQMLRQLAA